MATFNGGRMSALLLCMLFSLTASFAQDEGGSWETVVVYMVDPIDEQLAPEVEDYIAKWNNPFTWETFEDDFTPAREGQMAEVARDNEARIQAAKDFLKNDHNLNNGISKWYPSWIPLASAKTTEDSLFKNILDLPGRPYGSGARIGQEQSLSDFFELDGTEPFGLNPDGSQKYRSCDEDKRRCRKEFYADFRELVEIHQASLTSETAPRIISFAIQVKSSISPPPDVDGFVDELNEEVSDEIGVEPTYAEFNYESIRLLQPAAMDPDEYVIDTAPYWQPAAKPVSSETSSWGHIKATFAD